MARPHHPGAAVMAAAAACLATWLAAAPAAAHDTWWAPATGGLPGAPVLALGTGNRFPVQEVPLTAAQLQASGCRGDGGTLLPLRPVAERATALLLQPAAPARTCWAQTLPLDIQIDDRLVEVYLHEIQAPPALRARWAAQKARGVRWQESYVKHARIELDGPAGAPARTEPEPALGLDVRLEATRRPLRAGDSVQFQVLRDGQPLAGLAVELRSDLSPLGLWRQTDTQGRVNVTLPLAARWVLRGVDLRPSATQAEHWESRFVTLAFEVQPAAALVRAAAPAR